MKRAISLRRDYLRWPRSSRPGSPRDCHLMGHEDQFRPSSLSGGCRLGKATFAGTTGKGEDAP